MRRQFILFGSTAYLEANDSTRRLFSLAFFARIYIDEDDETRE